MEQVTITGGAGFIGSRLAARLLGEGHQVRLLDDLSRPGSALNVERLREQFASGLEFIKGSVTDGATLRCAVEGSARIYHLAGQVTVVRSVAEPLADFEANALGTLQALEAARRYGKDPIFVYASTNKVYGSLDSLAITTEAGSYQLAGYPEGVPEEFPVDPHSPYACSKAAGDQYARDYCRTYGLRTVVLRQSCIYGPGQRGSEEQGWISWFLRSALCGRDIHIYGDGRQVRDVLFIDDLLDAYQAVVDRIDVTAGEVFNVGGGPRFTLAVWAELGPILERLLEVTPVVLHYPWRPGDQKIFVCDIRKLQRRTGWAPRVSVSDGIAASLAWTQENLMDLDPRA